MKVLILLSVCVLPLLGAQNGCRLPIGEYYSPLLLYGTILSDLNSDSVIQPGPGGFLVDNKQQIMLVCPDRFNVLKDQAKNNTLGSFAQFVCQDGKILLNEATSLDPNNLKCVKPVRGKVSRTSLQCAHQQGLIYNIGYNIGAKFLKIYKVCYDRINGNSLYAKHILFGKFIKDSPKALGRPDFNRDGVDNKIAIVDSYSKKSQERLFLTLLKSSTYINSTSYLARGHLAPDADFTQAPLRLSTYFYINASPMWQIVNQANWIRVENSVRKTAERLQEDLEIYTGNHEVLELPNKNQIATPIYLVHGKKVAVPKYVWKIVYHRKWNKAVVLIVLNNPFVDHTPTPTFCSDVCLNYNWNCPTWRDYKKGYVFCCKYSEFQKVVRNAPQLQVDDVLDNNLTDICAV